MLVQSDQYVLDETLKCQGSTQSGKVLSLEF